MSETIAIETTLSLLEDSLTPIHFTQVSTQSGLLLIEQAQKQGLPISCDVSSAHVHCHFNQDQSISLEESTPPLGGQESHLAIRQGLLSQTIQMVTSAPLAFHPLKNQHKSTGTLLRSILLLAEEEELPLLEALALCNQNPAHILGLKQGKLTPGSPADVIIFDKEPILDGDSNQVTCTLIEGNIAYQHS